MNTPCKDCICLPICKARMKPYINNSRAEISYHIIQLAKKCLLIDQYIVEVDMQRSNDESLLVLLTNVANEAFK